MKLHTALPLLVAAACSSSSNGGAPPDDDAGTAGDQATGDDASSADAQDAVAGAYTQAVLTAKWKAVPSAPTVTQGEKQDDIFFSSASVGYAVSGPLSTVYKTTDGGTTWNPVFTHAGTYFRSLLFVDDDHGFASNLGPIQAPFTDTNVLYSTTDGGKTWNPVTAITGPMPTGICNQTMIDAKHLVAVGRVSGPCFMMTSGDGGGTWTSTDMNSQLQMLIDARFTSPADGIVVGGSAGNTMYCTILRTTDGGGSWHQVFQSATSGSLCWKISFPSSQVGYVSVQDTAGGASTFAKTIDGGQSWKEMPLQNAGTGYPGIGIGFITEDIGWISPEDPAAFSLRTTDGGKTWAHDSALLAPINRFRFLSPTTAFAIGGTIWRLDVPWTGGEP